MEEGTEFKPVLPFFNNNLQNKTNILFCSGKVSYELQDFLNKNPKIQEKTLMIVIEELFPFPEAIIKGLLNGINAKAQGIWVQEEPINSGGYSFVEPRLYRILKGLDMSPDVKFCGRRALACPAIGWGDGHKRENKEIMEYLIKLCE